MLSPQDCGCIDDPNSQHVAHNSKMLQTWFDAGKNAAIEGKAGTFAVNGPMRVSPGTTIDGAGAGFIVKAGAGFPADQQLLLNEHIDVVAQGDRDIRIIGARFEGNPKAKTSVEMAAFVGVRNLTLRDCLFTGWRSHALSFRNCSHVTLDRVEITDYSNSGVVAQPGACLFEGGCGILAYQDISDFTLKDCYIHDGGWTGVLATGSHWTVDNLRIYRVHEAGIFGGPTYSTFSRSKVIGVRLRDCSAHGFEVGGHTNSYIDNLVGDCDYTNMLLSNPINVIVALNRCYNPMQIATIAAPVGACIAVRNHGDLGQYANTLSITDNTLWSDNNKVAHAIGLYNQGMGPINNCRVRGNNRGSIGQWKSGRAVDVGPDTAGENWDVQDGGVLVPPKVAGLRMAARAKAAPVDRVRRISERYAGVAKRHEALAKSAGGV